MSEAETVREYRFETLAQIADAATSANVEDLIADLGEWVRVQVAWKERLGWTEKAEPILEHMRMMPGFTWRDDGIRGVSGIRISITSDPEDALIEENTE